ncbi:hypothetical protein [Salinibacter ruber]|uniref:hypothetical protein n=1 Tax=Salinibacter ruber TaxID=146919 RepID=UPI000E598211|nr:hypothetical protein [Salinibacter ruber]
MDLAGLNGPELLMTGGLLLDVVGVVIVWKFGLPAVEPSEGSVMKLKDRSEAEEFLDRVHTNCGMTLIVAGFMLQILSTWIS